MPSRTRIVGHRGAKALVDHENTLHAFARTAEVGARWVELDVRRLGDGELVVFHDPVLDGKPLYAMGLDELRGRSRDRGYRVPTLDEALRFCAGRLRVDIELKELHTESASAVDRLAAPLLAAAVGELLAAPGAGESVLRAGAATPRSGRHAEVAAAEGEKREDDATQQEAAAKEEARRREKDRRGWFSFALKYGTIAAAVCLFSQPLLVATSSGRAAFAAEYAERVNLAEYAWRAGSPRAAALVVLTGLCDAATYYLRLSVLVSWVAPANSWLRRFISPLPSLAVDLAMAMGASSGFQVNLAPMLAIWVLGYAKGAISRSVGRTMQTVHQRNRANRKKRN